MCVKKTGRDDPSDPEDNLTRDTGIKGLQCIIFSRRFSNNGEDTVKLHAFPITSEVGYATKVYGWCGTKSCSYDFGILVAKA